MSKTREEVMSKIITNWMGLQKRPDFKLESEDFDPDSRIVCEAEGCMEEYSVLSIQAFTHWLYYADDKFIAKAWAENPWMGTHLQSKLTGFMNRYGGANVMSLEALIRWHQELDDTNTAILYKYIMDNHLNKWR